MIIKLPLDFQCPACKTVGVVLTLTVEDGKTATRTHTVAIPAEMSCSNPECDQHVNYGPVPATVEREK